MNYKLKTNAFSLTEVLLAVGILAVGMIFIAGTFPVAIHFTTVATERTIAAVAADEAFAKIKLYADGINLNQLKDDELKDFNNPVVFPTTANINANEFVYPSTDASQKQYCWSALCRRVEERLVQVTVFVCRKTNPNLKYPGPGGTGTVDWPMPVKVSVSQGSKKDELDIESGKKTYINDGYSVVDDRTGRLYRVLERYTPPEEGTILLDRDWDDSPPGSSPANVWVVPPAVNGGRYPCIAIYQKVIRF